MEYLDILDENGKKIDLKKERGQVHVDGDWHKVVQIFIVNENGIMLQQRSMKKKSDPGKWCASASGHISAGESSINAALKEIKEELGVFLNEGELKLIDTFKSPSIRGKIINNHFVDLYIVTKNIKLSDVTIQEDELEKVEYFTIKEFIDMVNNNDERLTNTPILFEHLINYMKKV